jgi:hypothetical protein
MTSVQNRLQRSNGNKEKIKVLAKINFNSYYEIDFCIFSTIEIVIEIKREVV